MSFVIDSLRTYKKFFCRHSPLITQSYRSQKQERGQGNDTQLIHTNKMAVFVLDQYTEQDILDFIHNPNNENLERIYSTKYI